MQMVVLLIQLRAAALIVKASTQAVTPMLLSFLLSITVQLQPCSDSPMSFHPGSRASC
jgi:hypothetical protein